MNEAPKYASPYPAHGQYEGPPVMAPPQYYAAPPPSRKPGLLEGWVLGSAGGLPSAHFWVATAGSYVIKKKKKSGKPCSRHTGKYQFR
ncbi:uncharacterized protein LOC127240557 isoform X2 [Andrographis paniculata]|uniref:uncharacterized protein LOC127240557 isoform X2 n=1 Tax=Andrographis paniculata TaxID=175694 RepID=UPI0021E76C12|nr:uncharacterized protein LOC127240557 isoform X2 [Andrographis paniculata]